MEQRSVDGESRKGEEGIVVTKSDSNGRSATPTTAIPYSGGLAGDCGFAYPLLVYWNRSLSVPLSPSLSLYSKIIPSRSLSRLLSSSFHPFRTLHPLSYTFRRSFFDSVLSTKRTRFTALRDFISPSFSSASSSSLALYLPISISPLLSIALSAAQTLDHVHKAHRSPAFITRYEIAPRLRPGSPIPTHSVYVLRTRRRRDIYWQTLRMSDHAGLRSSNIVFSYTLVPYGSNPRAEMRYASIISCFYYDENLIGICSLSIKILECV